MRRASVARPLQFHVSLCQGLAFVGSALVAVALVVCAIPCPAAATPQVTTPQIEQKRVEAAAARDKLDDLRDEAEMRSEAHNAAVEELEKTRAKIVRTQADIERISARLTQSEAVLATRADSMYRNGKPTMLEVVLGTRSFEDLLTRLELFRLIGQSDARLVESVRADKRAVEVAEDTLMRRENEQIALRAQAEAARIEAEAARKRQQDYLASLNGEISELVRAEEARQTKLAEERARKAKALAAARAAARSANSRVFDPSTLPLGRAQVIDVALRYLGVAYVWGGVSPSGFDCSGLVQYCYREVGVSLPRTSSMQYTIGTRIPADRLDLLKPGDLVFFGYGGDPGRIHHVGMCVGDGDFIHAPASGDVVRISSLTERISSRGDYVGATRP